MKVVPRRMADGTWKTFHMYPEQEAKDLNIPYKPWREIQLGDEGKYFLSDDGWVSECLSVKKYKRNHVTKAYPDPYNTFVRLVCGRGVVHDNGWGKLIFQVPGHVYGEKKDLKRRQLVAAAAADMIVKGNPMDWDALGLLWRPNSGQWKIKNVQRLLSTERMKEMVKADVIKSLQGSQWSVRRVLNRYNKLYLTGLKKGDLNFAKDILDKISVFLDMEPDRQTVSWQGKFDMGNSQPLLPEDADEMDAQASLASSGGKQLTEGVLG